MSDSRSDSTRRTALMAVLVAAVGGSTVAEAGAVDSIAAYCNTSWRNAGIARQDWQDCTQEAFAELLDRVSRDGLVRAITRAESGERRELNRSIWCTIQRWRRTRRCSALPAEPHDARAEPPARYEDAEEIDAVLHAARKRLSPRQARIVERVLAGSSVREIAAELDVPPARVSDEKYKAVRRLRRFFETAESA